MRSESAHLRVCKRGKSDELALDLKDFSHEEVHFRERSLGQNRGLAYRVPKLTLHTKIDHVNVLKALVLAMRQAMWWSE